MAEETRIEWADHTFNPWIGCTKVSPACDNCYAEAQASRYWPGEQLWAGNRKRTSENNWRQPLKWNRQATEFRAKHGRPPMVFCASLADVFDNQVPNFWRRDLWALIEATPDLIWLLLTKRPQNIRKMLPVNFVQGEPHDAWGAGWPNVWLGTTVENQAEADRRIPHLLAAPAAKRFLSCEPLLGPVDLRVVRGRDDEKDRIDALTGAELMYDPDYDGQPDEFAYVNVSGGPRIDWVIAGGESGREARPSHPDWFRSLRDQCAAAGVPFLFKQWGEWAPRSILSDLKTEQSFEMATVLPDGQVREWHPEYPTARLTSPEMAAMLCFGKKRAGRTLDGVIHDARPEVSP